MPCDPTKQASFYNTAIIAAIIAENTCTVNTESVNEQMRVGRRPSGCTAAHDNRRSVFRRRYSPGSSAGGSRGQ